MKSLQLSWMLVLVSSAPETDLRAEAGLQSATISTNRFVVNSTADPGDGVPNAAELTLREAIVAANATTNPSASDLILFQVPPGDPGHAYYRNDGVAGQVSISNITGTAVNNDALLSNPDPDWPRSWYSIAVMSALPPLTGRIAGAVTIGCEHHSLASASPSISKRKMVSRQQ